MTADQPLNTAELDRLNEFLVAIGPPAMNIEAVDGYFSALICGPEPVPASEYLPLIWGDDFAFESEQQVSEIVDLLMRHWNTIATALRRTLKVNEIYLPVLRPAADGVVYGNDWASGFIRGTRVRRTGWSQLMDDEQKVELLLPALTLFHEHDDDPETRPEPISAAQRTELLQFMFAYLTKLYRHFEPERQANAPGPQPVRRAAAKVGRNDPCPCGSGRKFKQCCLAGSRTLN